MGLRVFALEGWARLRFAGPDARKFLHGLLTADVLGMPEGGRVHACLLTPKGKLRADLDLYDRGDHLLAVADKRSAVNIKDDVGLRLMLSQTKLRDEGGGLWYAAPAPAGALPQGRFAPEGGFLLSEPAGKVEGVGAFEDWLVERGVPLYGRDFGEDNIIQEAGLDDAVSFTKGCYMGQETVSRVHHLGHPNRKIVRLSVEGEASPGAELHLGEDEVGKLTSRAGAAALGMVKTSAAKPGTPLSTPAGGRIVVL